MDLTTSYEAVMPQVLRERYVLREVRNAATILNATNPTAFQQMLDVLNDFYLLTSHLVLPGGQESSLAGPLLGNVCPSPSAELDSVG